MHAYDGPAELTWTANGSLAFASPVAVTVDELPGGWDVSLRATGDAEDFAALLFLGAPHELRFPDGSTFDVTVAGDRYDEFPYAGSEPPHDRWLPVTEFRDVPPVPIVHDGPSSGWRRMNRAG